MVRPFPRPTSWKPAVMEECIYLGITKQRDAQAVWGSSEEQTDVQDRATNTEELES